MDIGRSPCLCHILVCSVIGMAIHAWAQTPLDNQFTYQGLLKKNGNPVNGTCDLQFTLHDAASTGNPVGPTVDAMAVTINNGLFSGTLDFGAVFGGFKRWLQVAARCPANTGSYETLSPRQELTAAPNSLYASTAGSVPWNGLTGVPAGFSDNTDNDTTYGAGSGLTLTGTTFSVNFSGPGAATTVSRSDHTHAGLQETNGQLQLANVSDSVTVLGGYSGNSITSGAVAATISGGGLLNDVNRVTDDYGTVAGGIGNQAGNNAGTTIDARYATVGGGGSNTASGENATVGGGFQNTASKANSTVGGGQDNTASELHSTVAGGVSNVASGNNSAVGGGFDNTGSGTYATVSGGSVNNASGFGATVTGGVGSTASGNYATVSGGRQNSAQGSNSLAGGRRAKALHAGSFVWGDSTDADVVSIRDDQFTIRAGGGVSLVSNAGSATNINLGDYYRDNGILAWAKVSSAGALSAEFGVTSVTKDATGTYTVTLDAAATNAFSLVPIAVAEVDSAPTSAAAARLVTVDQLTNSPFKAFKVYITNGNFTLVDNDFVFVATGR